MEISKQTYNNNNNDCFVVCFLILVIRKHFYFDHGICEFMHHVVLCCHVSGLVLATFIQFWPIKSMNSSCHLAFGLLVGRLLLQGRHWRIIFVQRLSSAHATFLAHLHFFWIQRSRMSGILVVRCNHSLVRCSRRGAFSILLSIRHWATTSLEISRCRRVYVSESYKRVGSTHEV